MLTTAHPSLQRPAAARSTPGASHPALMVAFHLGVPLCMAVVMAWNPPGSRAPRMDGPFWPAFYWLGVLLPMWALLHLSTEGLRRALGGLGLRLPLLGLLLAASVLATLLMRPYLIHYWALVDRLLDPGSARALAELPPMWPRSIGEFIGTVERAGFLIAVWVAVNLFYVHALGVPRYGHAALAAGADTVPMAFQAAPAALPSPATGDEAAARAQPPAAPTAPAFLDRLPRDLGRDVLALQAQDHYLRVTTRAGSSLILYRFSDALREMEAVDGLRAHRSHWVARATVRRLVARNGRHFLLLDNGERIPVSRTYLEQVRQQLD
jgi:DNA-binding LytR/AlgR family response regulator